MDYDIPPSERDRSEVACAFNPHISWCFEKTDVPLTGIGEGSQEPVEFGKGLHQFGCRTTSLIPQWAAHSCILYQVLGVHEGSFAIIGYTLKCASVIQ